MNEEKRGENNVREWFFGSGGGGKGGCDGLLLPSGLASLPVERKMMRLVTRKKGCIIFYYLKKNMN